MRRRTFMQFAGALVLATGSGCSGQSSETSGVGRTYYVSAEGDDDDAGLTAPTAWRSVSKVNAELLAGTIVAGDVVRFECGQTFFGKLRPVSGVGGAITFTSYTPAGSAGAGQRPVLSSYKLLNEPAGWRRRTERTWVIDLSTTQHGISHTGYDGASGGADNIGFLRVEGVIHGRRLATADHLEQPWDFCCSGELLEVRSDANPALAAADIRAACDTPCVSLCDHLVVDGLRLEGSGGHGIQGTGSHVQLRNNELAELGGSQLSVDSRYGNGVEVWIGSSDVVVECNRIHDVYDSGMTVQGRAEGVGESWRDITFRGNIVYRCGQSLEFWSGAQGHASPGFVRCRADHNVFLFAGQSWSTSVRPDQDKGVHVLTYGWELPADISVTRNVFYGARSGYRYAATVAAGMRLSDNAVLIQQGIPLQVGEKFTVDQYKAWVSEARNDVDSVFIALPPVVSPDVDATIQSLREQLPDRGAQLAWARTSGNPC